MTVHIFLVTVLLNNRHNIWVIVLYFCSSDYAKPENNHSLGRRLDEESHPLNTNPYPVLNII